MYCKWSRTESFIIDFNVSDFALFSPLKIYADKLIIMMMEIEMRKNTSVDRLYAI